MLTEERRLVAEEGTLSNNTWQQKKEYLTMIGELLYWAQPLDIGYHYFFQTFKLWTRNF